MHIAASDPKFIRKEDVSPEAYEKEKEIYLAQAAASGKPPKVVERIVEGKMSKFYEEVCLYEQPFIKDQNVSIGQLLATKVGKLGENIAVRRFARFKVGEANVTIAFSKGAAERRRRPKPKPVKQAFQNSWGTEASGSREPGSSVPWFCFVFYLAGTVE